MSFKDLGKHPAPRPETPEDAELKARAAARHKAKEEKAARVEEHRGGKQAPASGGAPKREPHG